MPRTRVQNVKRRGAVYWWGRQIRLMGFVGQNLHPTNYSLSLRTKDLSIARKRAIDLTAFSERLRVSMMFRIEQEGLDQHTQETIFKAELRSYRDWLVNLTAITKAETAGTSSSLCDGQIKLFHDLWAGLDEAGSGALANKQFVDGAFGHHEEADREQIWAFLATLNLRDELSKTANWHLDRLNMDTSALRNAVAVDQVVSARTEASWQILSGNGASSRDSKTNRSVLRAAPGKEAWLQASPIEAAELFMAEQYAVLEHQRSGKRTKQTVSDGTRRDTKWACTLLSKSIEPGRTMASITQADLVHLDEMFSRLPINIGKSPKDREPGITLFDIEARALDKVDEGKLCSEEIGLSVNTTNKHWAKLAQVHECLRKNVDGIAKLDFGQFRIAESRDSRDAVKPMSVEQGRSLFSLPPWTGCDAAQRLTAGGSVIHDGLYFVPMIAWYTGARREEICKLKVCDVLPDGDLPSIQIRLTDTGRIKTHAARRQIPLHSELLRLGFLHFVSAMKDDGEGVLFPELYPGGTNTKRTIGDVFYKIWWTHLRQKIPDIQRGQAMHSARHMVENELKQKKVHIESRNDLMGHSQKALGEGASVYSERLDLVSLREMVELIPIVTDHLSPHPTNILPKSNRRARPTRTSANSC